MTSHFSTYPVYRQCFSALFFLVAGVGFIGCGGPPSPQVKEIIKYSQGSTSTEVYSYKSNDELKQIVQTNSELESEDRLNFSYREGQVSQIKLEDNVSPYTSSLSPDVAYLRFGYRDDLAKSMKLSFSKMPMFEMRGTMGYNSDDTLSEFELELSAGGDESGDRSGYFFDYTEGSLFDRVRCKSGSERKTLHFEYNSDELISEIQVRTDTERSVNHEFIYNQEGQLVGYSTRNEDCELSYNEAGLVRDIACTNHRDEMTIHEIFYNDDQSVEGMIPRIPGIGFGYFFSLDGRSLAPEDFAEPLSILSLLDW